jgi:hypothetical protein
MTTESHGSGTRVLPGEGVAATPLVTIQINRDDYQIARGRHTVADIKRLAKVPPTDDLEQVVDGELVPLPDDGHVVIRGSETFVSHPKTGASS